MYKRKRVYFLLSELRVVAVDRNGPVPLVDLQRVLSLPVLMKHSLREVLSESGER